MCHKTNCKNCWAPMEFDISWAQMKNFTKRMRMREERKNKRWSSQSWWGKMLERMCMVTVPENCSSNAKQIMPTNLWMKNISFKFELWTSSIRDQSKYNNWIIMMTQIQIWVYGICMHQNWIVLVRFERIDRSYDSFPHVFSLFILIEVSLS